ncbi:MAG: riboflavin kinase, partial [Gemmatimonadota bacterium]
GFGRGRSGDTSTLRELGRELGFEVDVVEKVRVGSDPVSSTRIRRLLAEGRVEAAAECLGRPYGLRGRVVEGMGRGRDLGFPTANLDPPGGGKLVPAPGIYAVRAHVQGEVQRGILHAGPRPTFDEAPATLEVYLLDFDRDIYGQRVEVEFLTRLREVRSFSSTDELVREMKRDRDR